MTIGPNLSKAQPHAGGPAATPQNQTSVGNVQGSPGQRDLRADPQRVMAELPRPEKAKSVLSRLAAGFKSLTQTKAQPLAAEPRRASGAAENTKLSRISEQRKALEPNPNLPAPDWVAGEDISIDPNGLMMFDKAGKGVALTGVMNVQTGKISLTAVMPRENPVEHDIGGFKQGFKGVKTVSVGPESEAFDKRAMPSSKAMKILGVKNLAVIGHEKNNLGTSHEQLAKDAEGILRTVGKGIEVPEKSGYIGFTIKKGEGSEEWPHEIVFRSGTFNQRFINFGTAVPSDWAT